jgi:hypothetical protein
MSANLAMVPTIESSPEHPALSPSRAAVARALGWRKDADAAISEAVKAQKAAEQLVGAGDKVKARIEELERIAASGVEPRATEGGVGQPTFPKPRSWRCFAASCRSRARRRRGAACYAWPKHQDQKSADLVIRRDRRRSACSRFGADR